VGQQELCGWERKKVPNCWLRRHAGQKSDRDICAAFSHLHALPTRFHQSQRGFYMATSSSHICGNRAAGQKSDRESRHTLTRVFHDHHTSIVPRGTTSITVREGKEGTNCWLVCMQRREHPRRVLSLQKHADGHHVSCGSNMAQTSSPSLNAAGQKK
jgi:hypothetical protein